MFDKETESKNESSNRRRFFHKILGLGVAAGATSLLLNHDKGLMPLAQAGSGTNATVDIDMLNYGVSQTELQTTSSTNAAFKGTATNNTGNIVGVWGSSASIEGKGILGWATSTSGETIGVWGLTDSSQGIGIDGYASAATGSTRGMFAHADSPEGTGIDAYSAATTGLTKGVFAHVQSINGIGVYGWVASLSGSNSGVYGVSDSISGIGVLGKAGRPGAKPIVAQAASGQTANLQEWQNTSGTPFSVISNSGFLGIGTDLPTTSLHIRSPVSNPSIRIENENNFVGQFIYCYSDTTSHIPFFSGRRARGTIASPTAVQTNDTLMRYGGSGYGTSAFPGGNRAILEFKAAQNWTDTNQGTYITFSTTPNNSVTAAERMRITDAGEIVPPTDNTGSIGTASRRWSLVRATTVTSGDLVFENGVKATEDGDGLAFLNKTGQKIAALDNEGNLHIKGKVLSDL